MADERTGLLPSGRSPRVGAVGNSAAPGGDSSRLSAVWASIAAPVQKTFSIDADGRTSLLLTALNFANGVIGAGILGLPAAIAQAGLILGIVMCAIVAFLSFWTIRLLGVVGSAHGVESYSQLAEKAFGSSGYWVSAIFTTLFAWGAMCGYLVIFADSLPPVLLALAGFEAPRSSVLLVSACGLLFPLCLLRQYAALSRLSVAKACAILFLAVTVVYYRFELSGQVSTAKSEAWKLTEAHSNALPALGSMAFAFVCHHQTFLAMGSLRDPTPARFSLTVSAAIGGSLCLSLLVAIAGYTTFWDLTAGDIILNYDAFPFLTKAPLLAAVRLSLALNMLITYPSEMMVTRATLEEMKRRWGRKRRWFAMAAVLPDRSRLARFQAEEAEEDSVGADTWKCGQKPNRGLWEHLALTLLLFGGSLGVALGVQDLSPILSITGSFTAVFLAFVFPAAIRLRLGSSPSDPRPALHLANAGPWLLLVFACVAFVTSTGFSLLAIIEGTADGAPADEG